MNTGFSLFRQLGPKVRNEMISCSVFSSCPLSWSFLVLFFQCSYVCVTLVTNGKTEDTLEYFKAQTVKGVPWYYLKVLVINPWPGQLMYEPAVFNCNSCFSCFFFKLLLSEFTIKVSLEVWRADTWCGRIAHQVMSSPPSNMLHAHFWAYHRAVLLLLSLPHTHKNKKLSLLHLLMFYVTLSGKWNKMYLLLNVYLWWW